jgi:pilus assembly protein CpaB
MRSTKSIILVVIAVGCGLVASIGISQVMESRATSDTPLETEPIYVALDNIPLGEPLTPQMLKVEEWPKDKIPEGAIRRAEDVEGRRPSVPLFAGEPILKGKLIDGDRRSGVSERIPDGFRVVSVKVNMESAASGLILPGDRVDVLVFVRGGGGMDRDRVKTGTRTILRDVTVFAVNERIDRATDEEESLDAKTVSLLVKPDQAEKMILAKQLGQIHLSLRKPDDQMDDSTEGADVADLEDSSRGSDGSGQLAQGAPPVGNGIMGLLEQIKAGQDNSSDTSIDGTSRVRVMHIHTPQGVETFHWDDENSLPREILMTTSSLEPPTSNDSNGQPEAEVSDDGDTGSLGF